jgi:hypothetical protein
MYHIVHTFITGISNLIQDFCVKLLPALLLLNVSLNMSLNKVTTLVYTHKKYKLCQK